MRVEGRAKGFQNRGGSAAEFSQDRPRPRCESDRERLFNSHMKIIETKTEALFEGFIHRCEGLGVKDISAIRSAAFHATRFYKGQSYDSSAMAGLLALDEGWFSSLETGRPDYSVYSPEIYLAHLWACWVVYSRKTIMDLCIPKLCPPFGIIPALPKRITIADLGCGLGFTTALLKELLPDASVIGTNLPGTMQRRFADKMGADFGFETADSTTKTIRKIDVIFASEYFEHIEDPVQHLKELCDSNSPTMFIMANAFGAKSHGHFNNYKCFGQTVTNKKIGRVFNSYLRWRGYEKVKTKMWNNRPAIFQKSHA